MPVRWDPTQYNLFADHRGRPFVDLLQRIQAEHPKEVVDLGCGPGNLTALLAERWPAARIRGIDSSPEMIAAAQSRPGISCSLGDAREFTIYPELDVLISNATLHWVPEHRELLAGWSDQFAPGGWIAFQVPGNFASPSHTLLFDLVESPRWSNLVGGLLEHGDRVDQPTDYATLLLDHGLLVDTWETTYVHVLTGDDPVLEWMRGTALRPVLQALSDQEAQAFEREFAALLRVAYPARPAGTLLPFRRIFAVGRKP